MILSSADLKRILGGNQIIRLSAIVEIVERKPALSGREGLFIYIKRYPELSEFEATFTLWIESDGSEPDDIVISELLKILPKAQVKPGLLTEITTTEFRSQSTLEAPAAAPAPQIDLSAFEARFEALMEEVRDQMLLVHSGRPGKDGANGRDGVDGRDGRDLVATEASLEDLQNVEQNIAKEDGQVLTWKNGVWQNLFIPQIVSSISGGGGTSGTEGGGGLSLLGSGAWRYSSSTAGNPASSRVQFDNADPSLATFAYVSRYNNENKDVYNLFPVLVTTGTLLYIQGNDADNYYLYEVTADTVQVGGTHLEVSIALIAEGADSGFSNNDVLTLGSYSTTPGGGGVEEAPLDGAYYVRQNGQWVNLADALLDLQEQALDDLDAGDFTTGVTNANNSTGLDAGDFTAGTATTTVTTDFDGGNFTP